MIGFFWQKREIWAEGFPAGKARIKELFALKKPAFPSPRSLDREKEYSFFVSAQ